MPTTIKMRCSRVSAYDAGGQNLKEVQLGTTDRDGLPLNPAEEVSYANLTATFVSPAGDEIEHDGLLDVAITVATPEATTSRRRGQ